MKKALRFIALWVLIIGSAAWAAQDPNAFFDHVSVIAKTLFSICAQIVEWLFDRFAEMAAGADK